MGFIGVSGKGKEEAGASDAGLYARQNVCVRVCSLGVETGEVRVYREGGNIGGRIRTEEDYLDAMSVFRGASQEETSYLRTICALFGASFPSTVLPSVSVTFKNLSKVGSANPSFMCTNSCAMQKAGPGGFTEQKIKEKRPGNDDPTLPCAPISAFFNAVPLRLLPLHTVCWVWRSFIMSFFLLWTLPCALIFYDLFLPFLPVIPINYVTRRHIRCTNRRWKCSIAHMCGLQEAHRESAAHPPKSWLLCMPDPHLCSQLSRQPLWRSHVLDLLRHGQHRAALFSQSRLPTPKEAAYEKITK